MKTIQDQIKDLRNTRAHKAEQMEEVAKKAIDEGRSMDSTEAEEFDTLEGEIKAIDADLERFEKLEKLNVQRAAPVQQRVVEKEVTSRGPTIIVNKEADEKFKGQNFTRIVIAKALARLDDVSPIAIAQQRWSKSNPLLVEVVKAAVAGGGSGSGEWGAELVQADSRFTGDFIEYLYSRTVYDQIAFREVPANVTIKGQDGAATAYWTGENQPIKVSKADFSTVSLTPLKVAALAVVSNELLRDSSPAAEQLVRDALVEASSQRIDSTVFSATAASSGVSPAGLLNGLSPISATGLDADSVRDGIRDLYSPFLSAKNASGLTLVMNPARAKAISLMRNALGQREFPELNAMGGSLEGDPVVTGDNVNEAHVILLKASDIYKIGDGGVQVSISRDATLEQADDPTGETTGGTAMSKNMTSMFQTESTAIKVVRSINFAKRRTSAVAYVGDASWGDSAS
ncbi:MAG: phage major capsid protein [Pigmentiphaga sp.]